MKTEIDGLHCSVCFSTGLKCIHTACSQTNCKYITSASSKNWSVQGHFINKEEIAMKHLAGFAEKELWNVIMKCSIWKWVHKMAGVYSFSSCEPRSGLANTVVTAVLVEMCQLQLNLKFALWLLHIKYFHCTAWKSCQHWKQSTAWKKGSGP